MLYKSYLIENNISNLKEKISLFYGENLGLQNDFKRIIKEINSEDETLYFNQDEIIQNKNVLIKEITNVSLFEKNKIFFIENINDKFLDIVMEIEKIIADNKLFLFSDILEKRSKLRNYFEKSKMCAAIPCYADNDLSLKKIIQSKLKGFSGLTGNNVNLILENSNLDRAKLNNELEKIKTLFQDKIIKSEKLELLLNAKSNDDFDKLKDQAFLGNKKATNKLLSETIIDSDKNIFYLNVINQRLYKISETLNEDGQTVESKINSLKPPIFWRDKPNFISQIKKWNKSKIDNVLKETYMLEKEIKSNSTINKNVLVKKLIIDICQIANS
tara:strand:+ start:7434 stop:8420 length:987 start_codon:yes stop_codon:yes gene_type:complete